MDFYHEGMRELQDRYEGRAVADRLAGNRMRNSFTEQDRGFIESAPFFFLATSSPGSTDSRSRAATELALVVAASTSAETCSESFASVWRRMSKPRRVSMSTTIP